MWRPPAGQTGPGNIFRGCYSHNNIDDGWDLYTKTETGPIDPVILDRCIAASNGSLKDGTTSTNGDRNGFKLGGEGIAVSHVVTRCAAFRNGKNGFTWNSNPGAIRLINCLAFDNSQGNYVFGSSGIMTQTEFINNISFWTSGRPLQSEKHAGTDVGGTNCWWDASKAQPSINSKGLVVTAEDFAFSLANPAVTRLGDGSLDFSAFGLAAGSDLIDAGAVPSGTLPFIASTYYVGAPDLGAIERGAPTGSSRPFSGRDRRGYPPGIGKLTISIRGTTPAPYAYDVRGNVMKDSRKRPGVRMMGMMGVRPRAPRSHWDAHSGHEN